MNGTTGTDGEDDGIAAGGTATGGTHAAELTVLLEAVVTHADGSVS